MNEDFLDIYDTIHNFQYNSWGYKWLYHERAKEIKKSYLKLIFKSYYVSSNVFKNNEIKLHDLENVYIDFIIIKQKLQMLEAQENVKSFLASFNC